MKKRLCMVLAGFFLLTACAPNFGEQEEIVQETEDDSKEKAIIPKYNISDSYYRTILTENPGQSSFKPGEARGLVSQQLNTRLDIDEFETGLMRVAHNTFAPDKYLYQEGQYIKGDTIKSWLRRELTGKELTDAQATAKEADKAYTELGLNPGLPAEGDLETIHKKYPIYLSHILEHNYLVRKDDTVELGGVVIGLAMNSIYYFRQEDGFERDEKINTDDLLSKGKEIAQEVINRVRKTKGLEKVPIVIAIYEQEEKKSIVPGNFVAKTVVKEGSNSLGKWDEIKEDYYFFPSDEATADHRDDVQMFNSFKTDIETFFPNYTGVIGKAFYQNEELSHLDIEIPMQFYGKAEVIAFTQFVTGKVMDSFPNYMTLEVNIMSNAGQEALILKEPNQEEPTVHIYK